MKYLFLSLLLFVIFSTNVDAASQCSMNNGTTVIYVNGIMAKSELSVIEDQSFMEDIFKRLYGKSIIFDHAYNPSRGIVLDVTKTILQSYGQDPNTLPPSHNIAVPLLPGGEANAFNAYFVDRFECTWVSVCFRGNEKVIPSIHTSHLA
jgi:hypothetical protein